MNARKQILVVDDTAISLAAIERSLSDIYEIVSVNSGARALKYLEKDTPDLILLDISMANMDGVETLKKMRNMRNGKDIPVIMLTAVQEKKTVIECSKLGIYDFVLKPFDHYDLRNRIRAVWDKLEEQEKEKKDEEAEAAQLAGFDDAGGFGDDDDDE